MDTVVGPRVFDRMSALGDLARSRMLVLLEQGELTVSELVRIVQLPQSTVSRHLKVLADDGWVTSRQSGTHRYYRMVRELDEGARELWDLVRSDVAATGVLEVDRERADAVLRERRMRSEAFFASSAGAWDRLRDDLFGVGSDVLPLLGLLDPGWTVGDLGTGTGQLAARLAPFVRRVVAIDASPQMLEAAQTRLRGATNVDIRQGDLERLPVHEGELDVAICLLVLHYVVQPLEVLREARRGLRTGGRLVIVDMREHAREGYREEMGHVWPGFDEATLARWHREAGLEGFEYRPVPARADASGPALFVSTATRRQDAPVAVPEDDHVPDR